MDIGYPKTVAALLKGADRLFVLAPAATLDSRRFPSDLLPPELTRLVTDVAKDATVGLLGGIARTLTGQSPRTLVVGALPDRVSRYHPPARTECIRKVVRDAGIDRGTTACLALLDDRSHALPVASAIARALPGVSLASGAPDRGRVRILLAHPGEGLIPADPVLRETVGAALDTARLVDSPPTDMNPEHLAAEARRLLAGLPGVQVREIRGARLLSAGLGGIHAVGRAAVAEPRVLIATHSPARAPGPHVALVGKGVTYDTGGLHLKSRGAMETMKADMGGAAAALGAFRSLAATRVRRRVSLVLCLAENAIGPVAYKPDDVLTMHSGKTVEINNTDAEGRLLLADGVSYAARKLGADVVFDAATLTGAQLIATGLVHAAVVTNDADLEALAVRAGLESGDPVHPLPFAPELYRREFKSPIADMRNSVKNRSNAQSSCAAEFVHWHLEGTQARWCHIDLAGPAFRDDRATGYGVALLAHMVRGLE